MALKIHYVDIIKKNYKSYKSLNSQKLMPTNFNETTVIGQGS